MPHVNCTCTCVVCMNITPYVAPALPANPCPGCGTFYRPDAAHFCQNESDQKTFSGSHNHNVFAAGIAYDYAKDARYRDMIKALSEQYPNIPVAEIIKDLLAGRGVS